MYAVSLPDGFLMNTLNEIQKIHRVQEASRIIDEINDNVFVIDE